jgi:hypothetical protein
MGQYELFCYLWQSVAWCMILRVRHDAGACSELNEQGVYCSVNVLRIQVAIFAHKCI